MLTEQEILDELKAKNITEQQADRLLVDIRLQEHRARFQNAAIKSDAKAE